MKEKPNLPTISDAQREIMNIVWDQGEVGVAEVWRILSARRPLARNTILTLITRLVDKGWLTTRQVGNAFRYTAAWPREMGGCEASPFRTTSSTSAISAYPTSPGGGAW